MENDSNEYGPSEFEPNQAIDVKRDRDNGFGDFRDSEVEKGTEVGNGCLTKGTSGGLSDKF